MLSGARRPSRRRVGMARCMWPRPRRQRECNDSFTSRASAPIQNPTHPMPVPEASANSWSQKLFPPPPSSALAYLRARGGFLNRLAALARVLPVMPLFGGGETKLQPVFVGDVAEAVVKALAMPATRARSTNSADPGSTRTRSSCNWFSRIGRKRLLMPVPYFAWKAVAAMAPCRADPYPAIRSN